jgi:hypothetical protein
VRRLDERSPRIGDRRAPGLGKKPQRAALAQRRQQRTGGIREHLDTQLAHRHAGCAEERAGALRVLDGEIADRADGLQRRLG